MSVAKPRAILVSACLLGLETRYDGVSKKNDKVTDFVSSTNSVIIPVCPEQLAGLPTPRPEARFQSGDGSAVLEGTGTVLNRHREDVSELFIRGAEQTIQICNFNQCRVAIMKERSPSCGVHQIYRESGLTRGSGVTTALLRKNSIAVFSEDELEALSQVIDGSKD